MDKKTWALEHWQRFSRGQKYHKQFSDMTKFADAVFCLGWYYWHGDPENGVEGVGKDHAKRQKLIKKAIERSGVNLTTEQKWYIVKKCLPLTKPKADQQSGNRAQHLKAIGNATACLHKFVEKFSRTPGVRELASFANCHHKTASKVIKRARAAATPKGSAHHADTNMVDTGKPTQRRVAGDASQPLIQKNYVLIEHIDPKNKDEQSLYKENRVGPAFKASIEGSESGIVKKENIGKCKWCARTIVWANNDAGKWVPHDPITRKNHLAVCTKKPR